MSPGSQPTTGPVTLDLVGQWRARMSFESGEFAAVEGLEFMYAPRTAHRHLKQPSNCGRT